MSVNISNTAKKMNILQNKETHTHTHPPPPLTYCRLGVNYELTKKNFS